MAKKKPSTLKLGILTAVLAGYVGFSSYAVMALFTDTEIVDANTFTTGTVDLTTAPATAAVTFADMAPGDAVAGAITVTNAGTLDFRYAVTSITTEDVLAAELVLTVRIEADISSCTTASVGAPVLYNAGDLGSVAGIDLIGDPTPGAQAGDRNLAAAASEVLCFQVSLPLATGNGAQGISTTAEFTFQAEQTKNNP